MLLSLIFFEESSDISKKYFINFIVNKINFRLNILKKPLFVKKSETNALIKKAIKEDIGSGDITSLLTIKQKFIGTGTFILKQDGVVAGLEILKDVYKHIDPSIIITLKAKDGKYYKKGKKIVHIEGKVRSILKGERTALNFLQRMSGIASLTYEFVNAVKGTKAVILDTRKTLPTFRMLDKWAVQLGGGSNHRFGLYDCILIKENHIIAAGGIKNTLENCLQFKNKNIKTIIEVRNISELKEVMEIGCDRILLDNMNLSEIKKAVKLVGGRISLEVSGNITLANVKKYAETGIDYISVGMLTHSVKALDISFMLDNKLKVRN